MWQVRVAAEDYHAEFAQKEATIALLTSDAEAQRISMQQKIDKLAADMEVSNAVCIVAASVLHLQQSGGSRCLVDRAFACTAQLQFSKTCMQAHPAAMTSFLAGATS